MLQVNMLPECLTVILLIGLPLVSCLDGKVFRCAEPNEQTIEVKCPAGTVIRINEAIYGVNQYNLCLYTKGDCIEYVDLDNECCGRNSCNVTYWRVYSVKCNDGSYVSFFRLIYDCIPPLLSECEVKTSLIVPNTKSDVISSEKSTTTISHREGRGMRDSVTVISVPEEKDSEDLAIILGSAVIVALLLASIIAVVFLLKKFQWQSEKQCFLQMFVGLCTRHPPDGCENPDENNGGQSDCVTVVVNTVKSDPSRDKNDNVSNDLQIHLQTAITEKDSTSNKDQSCQNSPSEQKRKRKRNEPLPDITMRLFDSDSGSENSPKLSNRMRQYKRNIKIGHAKQSLGSLNKDLDKQLPADITNITENKINFVVREGPGTTSV